VETDYFLSKKSKNTEQNGKGDGLIRKMIGLRLGWMPAKASGINEAKEGGNAKSIRCGMGDVKYLGEMFQRAVGS
jgi:hypothetical protein